MIHLMATEKALDCEAHSLEDAAFTFQVWAREFLGGRASHPLLREEVWIMAHRILNSSRVLAPLFTRERWKTLMQLSESVSRRSVHPSPDRTVRFDPLRIRALLPGAILLGRGVATHEIADTPEGPLSFVLTLPHGDTRIAAVEIVEYVPTTERLRLILLDDVPFPNPRELEVFRSDGKPLEIHRRERRLTIVGAEPGIELSFTYRSRGELRGGRVVRFERPLLPPHGLPKAYGFEDGNESATR